MLRLSECINEGFFGNSYDRYKRKVLDALASIGIVIDDKKMSKAEDWMKKQYEDRVDAYQCASALRDEIKKVRESGLSESFERYAAEIIDSAPQLQKKRAVQRIRQMTREEKVEFDHVVLSIADQKGIDPRELVASRGYDIIKLIQDRQLSVDVIIDKLSEQILKSPIQMSVKEALEIIRESGRRADKNNTDASDWMDMCKREMIKLGYGPVTANSYVTDEWRGEFIQAFKDGYTPKEAAEQMDRFLEEQENDES